MISDFLIIVALQEEADALIKRLGARKLPPADEDVRVYYSVSLGTTFSDGSVGTYSVVIAPLLGMGRIEAATATSDAIRRWNPSYILVVGIAGGVSANDVHLGDLIIADQVVDYELQKLTDSGLEIRMRTFNADPRLLGAAASVRGKRWHRTSARRPVSGAPKMRTGPIASGDKVVASEDKIEDLRKLIPKLTAVEMEAAGVGAAAFQASSQPGVLVIRAISDLADKDKGSPAVSAWRSYACELAASYAVNFLKNGPVLPSHFKASDSKSEPLPQADSHRFSIAVAHLLHDENGEVERILIENLRDLAGVQLLRFDRLISPEGPIPEQAERAGHETARQLLTDTSAQVLIWGMVLSHDKRTALRLFWTTSPAGIHSRKPYIPTNFELPNVFWDDLISILRLVAATTSGELLARRGEFLAAELERFVHKVENLLRDNEISSKWSSDARVQIQFICALGFEMLGEQTGASPLLERSIGYYTDILKTLSTDPLSLPPDIVRHNLGVALGALGSLNRDSDKLRDAASVFRQLADRPSLEREAPQLWASAQSNLGSALTKLAEGSSGVEEARSAVHAFRQAMAVWSKDRFPIDWGVLQNNLGYALQLIGTRTHDGAVLVDAIQSHKNAVDVWPQTDVPMFWAQAKNNLGNALTMLGEIEPGIEFLEQSARAYREALEERAFERDPLGWSEAKNNLGSTLTLISDRLGNAEGLREAIQALRDSLVVRTRVALPLAFASSKNNLGYALFRLGEYENKREMFDEAADCLRTALEIWSRDDAPARWFVAECNLAAVLVSLGAREGQGSSVLEAIAIYDRLLQELANKHSKERPSIQAAIAYAFFVRAQKEAGTESLEKSVAMYESALSGSDPRQLGFALAGSHFNLGETLRLLGQRRNNPEPVLKALESHGEAFLLTLSHTPYWAFRAAESIAEDLRLIRDSFQLENTTSFSKWEWVLGFLKHHEGHHITLQPFFTCVMAGKSGTIEPDWAQAPRKGDRIKSGTAVFENSGSFSYCLECKGYLNPLSERVAERLEWPVSDINEYLRRRFSAASSSSTIASEPNQEPLSELAALIDRVYELTNRNVQDARAWFRKPLGTLDGKTPFDEILRGDLWRVRKLVEEMASGLAV